MTYASRQTRDTSGLIMRDLSRLIHKPEVSQEGFRSLTTPTFRASTIVFDDVAAYTKRFDRGPDGYTYGLQGTPTARTLEAQLSTLEQAERTILVPSGQCAIALIFLTVLKPGDKVLLPDAVYPPVRAFCANYLAPRGITCEIYDPQIGASINHQIDDATRLIWMESPGSTTMEFQDIPAIARIAKERRVLTGCDNTWATPLLFKPLRHGVDFSMQALTKYVGGHSDLLLGSVSVNDKSHFAKLRDTMRMLGIGVSPDDCQLALRGIQTLGVRLAHIGRVAAEFAQKLSTHPAVRQVLHPAIPGCPGAAFWDRDFSGASGVFSILLTPRAEAALPAVLKNMELFSIGASWGGTHSLAAPISINGDRTASRPDNVGVILRLSIGLEDPADLWSDLERMLDSLPTA